MNYEDLIGRQERYHRRWFESGTARGIKAADRPPAHATARELGILGALAYLRFASIDHLTAFTGRKTRRVQETMESLRSKKLVAWFRWVDTRNAGEGMDPLSTTYVYCLTTKGAERCILDQIVEDDTYLLTRSWRGRPVLHTTMPHQISVVDILLGLHLSSRNLDSHDLLWAVPDFVSDEIDDQKVTATVENHGTKNEFRADLIACTRAKKSGNLFNLYFELERLSKDCKRVRKKFEDYASLFTKKNRRFNDGPPVLLYVITDCKHDTDTANRIELVRSWAKESPVAPSFRISTLSKVRRNAFGRVWTKVDGSPWGIGV